MKCGTQAIRQGSDACKTRFTRQEASSDDKLHHEDLEIGKPYRLRPEDR